VALFGKSRRWMWLGYLTLVLVACQASIAVPDATPTLAPTSTPLLTPSPAAQVATDTEQLKEYKALADDAINGITRLTRIIGGISIGVAGSPEAAREAAETVEAVKGSFEVARNGLERAEPLPGYEELHARLLDALSFYTDASTALLPDGETGEADYWTFQELMLEGGKNAHAAIAASEELRRQRN